VKIQAAKSENAKSISSLILQTATAQLRGEFSDDGWGLFQNLLCEETQKSLINNKKFDYHIVVLEQHDLKEFRETTIVGVLVTKDINHLFHFFISPQWQNRGVGKLLWDQCLKTIPENLSKNRIKPQNEPNKITVNSSDFALGFYQHLGFVMDSKRQMKKGICYTPMHYLFDEVN